MWTSFAVFVTYTYAEEFRVLSKSVSNSGMLMNPICHYGCIIIPILLYVFFDPSALISLHLAVRFDHADYFFSLVFFF